jgi:hypothetical protein
MDTPYQNREIDQLFKAFDDKQGSRHEVISQRMDVFESNTSTSLEEIKDSIEIMDKKVTYTNGKVRKTIIVLVLIGGIVIGQTFTNAREIISLIISII